MRRAGMRYNVDLRARLSPGRKRRRHRRRRRETAHAPHTVKGIRMVKLFIYCHTPIGHQFEVKSWHLGVEISTPDRLRSILTSFKFIYN